MWTDWDEGTRCRGEKRRQVIETVGRCVQWASVESIGCYFEEKDEEMCLPG